MTNTIVCAKISLAVEKLNICGSGSVVERHLAKVNVASSNLVFRSKKHRRDASDLVRHFCYKAPWPSGKAKVCNTYIPSSSLGGASKKTSTHKGACFFGGTPSPDSNEVLGKNAEHFDVAFENGVFESRVWVANIAWTEKSLPRSHSQNAKRFGEANGRNSGRK